MNEKIIGILGGMGPEATAYYFKKVIEKTKVKKDQDHFRVVIDSNSKIPDRTKAILSEGESPLEYFYDSIKVLENAGVKSAFIPCITAHYFYDDLQKKADFEIINAIEETQKYIVERFKNKKIKVGIIATSGTLKTGLFQKYFKGVEILYPSDYEQENMVMEAIYNEDYGIKSGVLEGKPIDLLVEVANSLIKNGADIIIAGCTEIGLVMDKDFFGVELIDPMEIAIDAIIKE